MCDCIIVCLVLHQAVFLYLKMLLVLFIVDGDLVVGVWGSAGFPGLHCTSTVANAQAVYVVMI